MTANIIAFVCLAIGLSSALVAGVFQSFSDFVMRSLVAASPSSGIESMQQINRKVFRSFFLVMLLGMAPVSIAFVVYAAFAMTGSAATWIVAGASIYLASVFLVTMLGNVPLNKRLDVMDPSRAQTVRFWQTYVRVWTGWNHVRTLGSLATAVCFILAGVAVA